MSRWSSANLIQESFQKFSECIVPCAKHHMRYGSHTMYLMEPGGRNKVATV